MVGLIAGDPIGYCGETSSTACLKAISNLAVPASVAALTLVLAYGQYVSGRRQAAASELQVRLAAVPLIENDIRAYQALASFIASFHLQVTAVKGSIDRIRSSMADNEIVTAYTVEFPDAIQAFDNTHEQATRFFNELKTLIIPPDAVGIQNSIIQIGSKFASGVGPTIFYMRTYLEEGPDVPASVGVLSLYRLRSGLLEDAERVCRETVSIIDGSTGEISKAVQALHERRSTYLNALV
jgi:hypothetical protein